MKKVSIIIPCYNVEKYIGEALQSALDQTYSNIEILVINDGSTDDSVQVASQFDDPRIRIVTQVNRGLNGARNTGINESTGEYFGFLDADDLWHPSKVAEHVAHLNGSPDVGMSFSWSEMINDDGEALGLTQAAKTKGITAKDIFCRNPIGNGSAAIIRKTAIEDLTHYFAGETDRKCYFDETFAQSTDIECWVRFVLDTKWKIEGIAKPLTYYRINEAGLSANVMKQYDNWEKMYLRTERDHPTFVKRYGERARAYQLRYLARRAVNSRDAGLAWALIRQALQAWPKIVSEEFAKTLTTFGAAFVLRFCGVKFYTKIESTLLNAQASTPAPKSISIGATS